MQERRDSVIFKVGSLSQWLKIRRLYRTAFPWNERKPFFVIASMWRKGKADVWYFESAGSFAGFATTINSRDLILLDYFAVAGGQRGMGIGSRMLEELKCHYAGKGLFVEIESEYDGAADAAQRKRRKRFYVSSGFMPMQVVAKVFGTEMELLGWNCRISFPAYHAFYRDNYSAWAAKHIAEGRHPDQP